MDEKPLPEISGQVDDAPVGENKTTRATQAHASAAEPKTYEPKTLTERLSIERLTFAQKLIGWCIAFIIILALVQHIWSNADSPLPDAIDILKVIVTTALGYVFGRAASDR